MCFPILLEPGRSALPWVGKNGEESLSEAQQKAEEQLLRLFSEIRGKLSRKLYALLGNEADVQDALQVAFLHCWRARSQIRWVGNVRSWIWRVSLNAGRDLLKYLRRRRTKSLTLTEINAVGHRASPQETVLEREAAERLEAALVHLRPVEREVFLMRQQGNLSYKEIARRCGCPIGTAKPLMRTAVRKLRAILAA
jgi:RNA polymerase sigma-70 factor (ECF subfamily)